MCTIAESELTPEFWQAQYEAQRTGWDRGGVHPALAQWLARGELSPCPIVVPGCGRGHEVLHLSQLGFDVTAIDYAETPLTHLGKQLKERQLSATLLQTDVLTFTPPILFDAVYEQTCLCAIEPTSRADYEAKMHEWLSPGGKLFVLFMQTGKTGGPPFDCNVEDMRCLFADARWNWPDEEFIRFPHPSGELFELATVLTRREQP